MSNEGFSQFIRLMIVLAVSFALFAWCESRANAGAIPLVDRLVKAQSHLPASKKDPEQVDAQELANAINEAALGDPVIAAALLATAWTETTLSDRLRRNECRPLECDRGRAWGLWQQHKDGFNREVWGSPDVAVQARHAARAMRYARRTCQQAGAPFPEGMLRQYGGRRCDSPVPREAVRVATFNQIRARL
jgi:hypothetical protein